jgi:uncharacterized protein YndB with AHSA1/START domain
VTSNPRGKAVIEFPNDLAIVITREFDAPLELVFDVMTKPEHVRKTLAPFGETVTICSIDLRVGGNYHFVFVTNDDGFARSSWSDDVDVDDGVPRQNWS